MCVSVCVCVCVSLCVCVCVCWGAVKAELWIQQIRAMHGLPRNVLISFCRH